MPDAPSFETTDPAVAMSLDGRSFTGRLPLDSHLVVGDFVVLRPPGVGDLLAQVLDKSGNNDMIGCAGRILGDLADPRGSNAPSFHRAPLEPAPLSALDSLGATSGATMEVGTIRGSTRAKSPPGFALPASTGTRSCVARAGRARPTRSASSLNDYCSTPNCG